MFDELLEHFGLGLQLLGAGSVVHFRQDEVDDVMLFERFEVHLLVVFLPRGVAECRIENLFFDLRVDLQLAIDLPA
ncbi:hypothetical protein D3C83_124610 [compost metagenome]